VVGYLWRIETTEWKCYTHTCRKPSHYRRRQPKYASQNPAA